MASQSRVRELGSPAMGYLLQVYFQNPGNGRGEEFDHGGLDSLPGRAESDEKL